MSPSTLARIAALHGQLSALYAELAAAEPAPQPAADRAIGLDEAAAMLGEYAKKIEQEAVLSAEKNKGRKSTPALIRLAELDPHLSRVQLVKYAGLSVPALRGYVDGPPGDAPPCDRIGGKIVVKRYCEAIEGLAVVAPRLELGARDERRDRPRQD